MSRRAKFNTPLDQARRLKEGRGLGEGRNYFGWLRTKDVNSRGRRHRIFGVKFDLTGHLMSDVERDSFYDAERRQDVVGLKDQFPLPLSETQKLAEKLGISRHPRFGNNDLIMSTDQVWTVRTSKGDFLQPVSCKYRDEAQTLRAQEINRIEKAYWETLTTLPLLDFNEVSVSREFVHNWEMVRGTLRPSYLAARERGQSAAA